ncbi:hypothetical protein [Amycolatopsis sp. NPDC003676]
MSETIAPDVMRGLRADRRLHFDHYGYRPPFASLGGEGIRQRLVRMEDPGAGTVHEVLDASGGYASACLGAARPVQLTDEIGSIERSLLLVELFGDGGLLSGHCGSGEYHVSGRSSGSEGMELALRLVLVPRISRRTLRPSAERGGCDLILAFEGARHGRTGGLVLLLNRRHFQAGLPSLARCPPQATLGSLDRASLASPRSRTGRAARSQRTSLDDVPVVPPAGLGLVAAHAASCSVRRSDRTQRLVRPGGPGRPPGGAGPVSLRRDLCPGETA